MRTIHFVCWLALPIGALVCGLGAAHAQPANLQQACAPDAQRLCSQFIPDHAKTARCMVSKIRQLSPECRTAMAESRHAERGHYARRYHHYHHHERYVRHKPHHY